MATNIVNDHMVAVHGYDISTDMLTTDGSAVGGFASVTEAFNGGKKAYYGWTVNEQELVNLLVALGIPGQTAYGHMPILHVLTDEEVTAWVKAQGAVEQFLSVEESLDPTSRRAAKVASEMAQSIDDEWQELSS